MNVVVDVEVLVVLEEGSTAARSTTMAVVATTAAKELIDGESLDEVLVGDQILVDVLVVVVIKAIGPTTMPSLRLETTVPATSTAAIEVMVLVSAIIKVVKSLMEFLEVNVLVVIEVLVDVLVVVVGKELLVKIVVIVVIVTAAVVEAIVEAIVVMTTVSVANDIPVDVVVIVQMITVTSAMALDQGAGDAVLDSGFTNQLNIGSIIEVIGAPTVGGNSDEGRVDGPDVGDGGSIGDNFSLSVADRSDIDSVDGVDGVQSVDTGNGPGGLDGRDSDIAPTVLGSGAGEDSEGDNEGNQGMSDFHVGLHYER